MTPMMWFCACAFLYALIGWVLLVVLTALGLFEPEGELYAGEVLAIWWPLLILGVIVHYFVASAKASSEWLKPRLIRNTNSEDKDNA